LDIGDDSDDGLQGGMDFGTVVLILALALAAGFIVYRLYRRQRRAQGFDTIVEESPFQYEMSPVDTARGRQQLSYV